MSPPATAASLEALLSPVLLLRAFYLAASLLIVVIQAVPALRSRFLAYGSRATSPSGRPSAAPSHPPLVSQLLDYVATFQVPHNWFTHFYVLSLACSLFWGWRLQIWAACGQLQAVWGLMLLQGLRRMLESNAYTSTSTSSMWFAHWLLGLVFYLTINVALWIEGPDGELSTWSSATLVPAILTAHVLQHSYHAYLYRLRTSKTGYQLPMHPIFTNLLCPHYTCETTIYLLLSFLAAPAGKLVNWTMFCGAVFVAVNLGVTAVGTKNWYMEKFGKDKVGPRKRIVPGIW
ncbi:3-oxo-5-alpha-steroid 4-dehydrogenase [Stagonosporopsis vannaccii]|nr:3-oxo-5-alpha-steroid 4-dehydrogenase [Stagonosporopsis vannaccii]